MDDETVDILEESDCNVITSTTYSGIRWNACSMKVHFRVPLDKYDHLDNTRKKSLKKYCNDIVDPTDGYDVVDVEIIPKVGEDAGGKLKREIIHIQESIERTLSRNILPQEVLNKGSEMSFVYLYLYCVENSLRLLIEDVGLENYGDDYFNRLHINNDIIKKIETRKKYESSDGWICIRGTSDIFYTDFPELGTIIENNWDIFKSYFPSIPWIKQKIIDLTSIRNLVAHNSYVGSDEQRMLSSYYPIILRQLGRQERKLAGK
ncbi:hypothetical protein [Methanocrinis sp.]|uniref:hypothetical protein n=1 Tax=Methanocrinis sp. TaxID=3101522 RepID=UPI003D123BEB